MQNEQFGQQKRKQFQSQQIQHTDQKQQQHGGFYSLDNQQFAGQSWQVATMLQARNQSNDL